jgi:SAM-dependent methyltransferase
VSFYPADLARIHDEGFGEFARAAAREALTRLPGAGLVVELGCGSGISSALLSEAGYDVLGFDLSPAMLHIARSRVPRATFVQGSIWDAKIPACAGVTAFGEVVNYAADERAGAERLPALFTRVYQALSPGGLFLFDFATPGRGAQRTDGPHVAEGEDWRIESETSEDPAAQTLERRMTIDAGGQRRTETHFLRLYDPVWVQKCLEGPGFRSEALDRYSDFGFWPGYAAFAAVKPVQPAATAVSVETGAVFVDSRRA